MHRPPVALQLWSVKDQAKIDFAGTVQHVAEIGYTGVELAGFGNLDAKRVRSALTDAGLALAAVHVNPQRLQTELPVVIDELLTLGASDAVCAFWPAEQYLSRAACEQIGEKLGTVGAALRAVGVRFSFHNHAPELVRFEGKTALDWILAAAAPRDLLAEPDVFWLHEAGYPPGRFLLEHGARCRLIHLRDGSELGTGPVDYSAVFGAIDAVAAADWLIVEQDRYHFEPLESVRRSCEWLRSWGRLPAE